MTLPACHNVSDRQQVALSARQSLSSSPQRQHRDGQVCPLSYSRHSSIVRFRSRAIGQMGCGFLVRRHDGTTISRYSSIDKTVLMCTLTARIMYCCPKPPFLLSCRHSRVVEKQNVPHGGSCRRSQCDALCSVDCICQQ